MTDGPTDDETARCPHCGGPLDCGFPPCSCGGWTGRPLSGRAPDTSRREVSVSTGRGFEIRHFAHRAAEGEEPTGEAEDTHHRVFLFGQSGSGKTLAACRASADVDLSLDDVIDGKAEPVGDERIFGLFLERNGLSAGRLINPKMGWEYADPFDADGTPNPVKALGIAVSVIRAAASGYLQEQGFTKLVIDGLTELQRLEKDAISQANRTATEEKGERVVREWFDRDDWSWLNEKSRRQLNTIRALPIDTICTALEETIELKSGAERVAPKFEGRSIPGEAMSFFNGVGRMERVVVADASGRESVSFRAQFTGASRYLIKSCGALTGWQKPSAPAWLDVLGGRLPATATRIRTAIVDVERPPEAAAGGEKKTGARIGRTARS